MAVRSRWLPKLAIAITSAFVPEIGRFPIGLFGGEWEQETEENKMMKTKNLEMLRFWEINDPRICKNIP
jgi:hypothetical protein